MCRIFTILLLKTKLNFHNHGMSVSCNVNPLPKFILQTHPGPLDWNDLHIGKQRTVEPFLGPRLAKLEMAKMKLPFSSSNEELLPTDMSIPETELTANSP